MGEVHDSRHGFTHAHIKGVDAAAHRFHERHAFALYVGDLQQSRLEAGRTLKSDGHFGVGYVRLAVVGAVPGVIQLLLVFKGDNLVQEAGEQLFSLDAGIGLEFGFFLFGQLVVAQRPVGDVVIGNINGRAFVKLRVGVEGK